MLDVLAFKNVPMDLGETQLATFPRRSRCRVLAEASSPMPASANRTALCHMT